MFERFTDRARRVVVLAQDEARLLKHPAIGTEHLLLGMVGEGEAVASQALTAFGVNINTARAAVEKVTDRGASTHTGHVPFTPRMKSVLERSLREALQLGHNYIGTEHIILALVREGEGAGIQALRVLGVDTDTLRRKVIDLIAGYQPAPPKPAVPSPLTLALKAIGAYQADMQTRIAAAGLDLHEVRQMCRYLDAMDALSEAYGSTNQEPRPE
jgi:ATP-dependent Clp protease ATP-binding subunit ClpC